MGGGASVPAENEEEVYSALKREYDTLPPLDNLPKLPESLEGCLKVDKGGEGWETGWEQMRHCFQMTMADVRDDGDLGGAEDEGPPELTTTLKKLPDAMDTAVYQYERWPLIVDPTGQAQRFLKYQRGAFLYAHNPKDVEAECLRKTLVGGLKFGSYMVLGLAEVEGFDIDTLFEDGFFPEAVFSKSELFKEDTFAPLLREAAGDPRKEEFMPRDEFKFVVTTKCEAPPPSTARRMCVIRVEGEKKKIGGGGGSGFNGPEGDSGSLAILGVIGGKEIKRNSLKLVEAAFDDEWDVIEAEPVKLACIYVRWLDPRAPSYASISQDPAQASNGPALMSANTSAGWRRATASSPSPSSCTGVTTEIVRT